MVFYRPKRAQIDKRITSDFEYELGTQTPRIPNTVERAFVKAAGGVVHGLYGRLDSIYRNFFPHLADEHGVIKIAAVFGLTRTPATRAKGDIVLSGTPGTLVPAATTRWVRADGTVYRILADHTITLNVGEAVAGEAVVSGVNGNCDAGVKLKLQTPLAGLNSDAEVGVNNFDGGLDREDWRALRERLLERLDNPPNGGGPGSYTRWAKEVSGVTRAWEYGKVPKLGHVTVLFLRDGDGDPFPGDPQLAEVDAHIKTVMPIHVELHVLAPIQKPLTVQIDDLQPNTADMRAAVRANIMAMLKERAAPASVGGLTFYRSWINEAISTTPGEIDHKLNFPAADVPLVEREIVWIDDPDNDITFV